MAQIVQIYRARNLALTMVSLAKDVRHLSDPAASSAPQYLDEYLVAQRMKIDALDGASPNHEITAHRICNAADDAGQYDQTDELRTTRNEAAINVPITDAAAFEVAGGNSDIRTTVHDLAQIQRDFRRVLKIRVNDCQNVSASSLPTSYHCRGETPFILSAHDAQAGIIRRQLICQLPGSIRTIVVDDDDLVFSRK